MKSAFLRRVISVLFLLVLSLTATAQNAYMNGYVIMKDGTRVDGLIRNVDWKYNPEKIKFKPSEEAEAINYDAELIREFGVDDLRYRSFHVEIDLTPESHRFLTSFKEPDNVVRTLFLKYIVDAEVDLLQYKESRFDRYFFSPAETDTAVQLIYKRYNADSRNVAENNFYQQQLLNEVNCGNKTITDLERLRYTEGTLIKYFTEYNACAFEHVEVTKKDNTFKAQLAARVGVDRLKLTVWSYEYNRYIDFPTNISPVIGFEGEIFSNFNRGKWSLLIGGSYHAISDEITEDGSVYKVNYPSMEWTLGYRYYMHLNKQQSIYLNVMLVLDSPLNPSLTVDGETIAEIQSRHFFGLGAGFKINGKFKLDGRVSLEHGILANEKLYFSDYSGVAVTATYVLWRSGD